MKIRVTITDDRGFPLHDGCVEMAGELVQDAMQSVFQMMVAQRDSAESRVSVLEEEARRFYHADGTFEVLASPEEVVRRRVECAASIAQYANFHRAVSEFNSQEVEGQ